MQLVVSLMIPWSCGLWVKAWLVFINGEHLILDEIKSTVESPPMSALIEWKSLSARYTVAWLYILLRQSRFYHLSLRVTVCMDMDSGLIWRCMSSSAPLAVWQCCLYSRQMLLLRRVSTVKNNFILGHVHEIIYFLYNWLSVLEAKSMKD